MEEIEHIFCSDGRSGEEIDICSVGTPLLLISEESREECPLSIEAVVKSEAGNLYITRYRNLKTKKAIDLRLEPLMLEDGFINAPHIKDFWVSGSETERFTKIKVRGRLKDQDLYELMPYPTKLKEVDWGQRQGVSSGAQQIIRLCLNQSLTSLNLNGYKIGVEGGKTIGQCLKTNTTLISLNLCGSWIGSEGAKAIGQGLMTNTTLTDLNLGDSQIDAEGAKAIEQGLATNTTLIRLNLNGNSINVESQKLIDGLLIRNKDLKKK